MKKRVLLVVEGPAVDALWPICVSRPPYMLRCGATLLWEKWAAWLKPDLLHFFCQTELAEVVAERTGHPVNRMVDWGNADIWVLDARWLLPRKCHFNLHELSRDVLLHCAGRTVGLRIDTGRQPLHPGVCRWLDSGGTGDFPETDAGAHEVPGVVIDHLWDVVNCNPEQIAADFDTLAAREPECLMTAEAKNGAHFLEPGSIYHGAGAQVGPQVVLDARGGPIILGANVRIDPHTYVEGPAALGENSVIFGSKIRAGSTIGPACRVGGEVEASVFLGWANKHHDGFLGHSLVGEWVNLGAMTTNSDLKNNYGPVKVTQRGVSVNTGEIKVGSFLADHTKTGIGTLLPTGGMIGFAGNIFGGHGVIPKYIPEFIWGGNGAFVEHHPAKARQTAEAVCRRRNVPFTGAQARLFDSIFAQSRKHRELFLRG